MGRAFQIILFRRAHYRRWKRGREKQLFGQVQKSAFNDQARSQKNRLTA
jgi:hypothetical protein